VTATTVRFDPTVATSPDELAIAALHLYAYDFAARLVKSGARVLDVGFGEGYGAPILLDAGAAYTGLEVDADAVEHARRRYGATFELYDGVSIPSDDDAYDLVVSTQVIAYFRDPRPWLAELLRVVSAEGTVVLTTPNRTYRLYEGQRPWNRYHAREYSGGELFELLSSTFASVELYGVHAREPIDSIVRARADRARRLARLDLLGLRYHLPESLNARIRRVLRRAALPDVDPSQFSRERVWHDASTDDALDLLAVHRPITA
jgi:SAM-dependent methyltransferase